MPPQPHRRPLLVGGALLAALPLAGCGLLRRKDPEPTQPIDSDSPDADSPESALPTASPTQCLSAEEAAQRTRPSPPPREEQGPEHEALPGEHLSGIGLALLPGGDRIAASHTADAILLGEAETYGTVIWNTADGTILEQLDNGLVGAIAASPDGQLALAGHVSVEIRDRDLTVQKLLTSGEDEPFAPRAGSRITDLAITADGSHLAVLGADGQVTLWRIDGEACEATGGLETDLETVTALALCPADGTLALCGPGGPVELWDTRTGERSSLVDGVPGRVGGLAYDADGTLYIAAENPSALYVLTPEGELSDGPELDQRGPFWVAAASERVAVVGRRNNRVQLWDRTRDEVRELPVVPGVTGRLVFSPDGGTLYAASPGEGVVAWNGGEQWRQFDLP